MDETLSQVCYTDRDVSKGIIVDESSTEERESECVHTNINKEKYAKNEAEYEEPSVTFDPVVKELSYFKISECGNNQLKRIDVTYERAFMATPRDK